MALRRAAAGEGCEKQPVWSSGVAFYPPSTKFWRIGGKWYDLEPFLNVHPGGSEVLTLARDRYEDCTFIFESHHMNYRRVRAVLSKYEVKDAKVLEDVDKTASASLPPDVKNVREATGADKVPQSLLDHDAFYSVLRQRVYEYLKAVGCPRGQPTQACKLLFWAVFLLWCVGFVYMFKKGTILSAALMVPLSGWLGAFGHNWIHQPAYRYWAILSLDTCGLSSESWYREHLMQHHMFTNTTWDNHLHGTEPFLVTDPATERNWLQRNVCPILFELFLTFGIFANYFAVTVDMFKGQEYWKVERLLFPVEVALLIWRWGMWGMLLTYVWIGGASMYYFTMALMNHNADHCNDIQARNKSADWAEAQLRSSADWDIKAGFYKSSIWLWLNYHTVHHLFPITDMSHHPAISEIMVQTCAEKNVVYEASDAGTIYRQTMRNFGVFRGYADVLVYAGA